MSGFPEDMQQRASLYASQRDIEVEHQLGYGKDGTVSQTSGQTAVKVFERRDMYARELACYQRFAQHQVEDIRGHMVPRLVGWDDELLVIEMEIVSSPYLLDFADAYLDKAPDFSDEVIEAWHDQKSEEFGEQRWEDVQMVLATLRGQYGIHLLDVHPGNITFGEAER